MKIIKMTETRFRKMLLTCLLISVGICNCFADENKIPEVFRGETSGSVYTIGYDDLDLLLKTSVLSMGKSSREKTKSSTASIGTRMKNSVNRLSESEGNRFWFEAFKQPKEYQLLLDIRNSLVKVPAEIELKNFNKYEQLAYWLNLYNVTLLSELAIIYPQRTLEDELYGKDSILNKKSLNISGVDLSLNNISDLLFEKFGANPLVIYGKYQGIVGGPNIRNHAYTGKNVYRSLESNAEEFINSNRGTYSHNRKVFSVSSLYERNKNYFPDFNKDLRNHLNYYLDDKESTQLAQAKQIKANIDNWHITDLFGTTRNFGGSTATNSAAMLDSAGRPDVTGVITHFDGVNLTTQANGRMPGGDSGNAGFLVPNLSIASESMLNYTKQYGRFSQEQIARLKELNASRLPGIGTVTISESKAQEDDKK